MNLKGTPMKLELIASLLIASTAFLHAAEQIPFSYHMTGTTENISGNGPVTPQKTVQASVNEDEKWGMTLRIEPKKTESDTMYRIRLDVKGASMVKFRDDVHPVNNANLSAGRGVITVFGITDDSNPGRWKFFIDKKYEKIEINSLTVEKIQPEEYYSNLLPDEGLEPGFWHGIWGKRDGCFPKLVENENSPEGKLLHFDAAKPGDGHKATMPLPYLPGRKYEISFWIRGNEEALISWQVAYGGIKTTRLGLKKEWTHVKMSGETPDREHQGGMFLVFVGKSAPLPEFDLGGVDFHYVK